MPNIIEIILKDTDNRKTVLTAVIVEESSIPKSQTFSFVDSSITKFPCKVKLYWSDKEFGYGTYGPYGGGWDVEIYVSVPTFNEESIRKIYRSVRRKDYFSI
jgi:hypothetical protein